MSCNICLEAFHEQTKIPKVLKCGHSLCEPCLSEVLKKSSPDCPFCQKSITDYLLTDFPTNFDLLSSSLQQQEREDPTAKCLEHALEPLTLLCKTCTQFICSKCVVAHLGHFLQDLSTFIKEGKQELTQAKIELKAKLLETVSDKAEIESRIASVKTLAEDKVKECEDYFDSMITALSRMKENAVKRYNHCIDLKLEFERSLLAQISAREKEILKHDKVISETLQILTSAATKCDFAKTVLTLAGVQAPRPYVVGSKGPLHDYQPSFWVDRDNLDQAKMFIQFAGIVDSGMIKFQVQNSISGISAAVPTFQNQLVGEGKYESLRSFLLQRAYTFNEDIGLFEREPELVMGGKALDLDKPFFFYDFSNPANRTIALR